MLCIISPFKRSICKYDFYISLTRTRSSHEGFGYASSRSVAVARIEFDGDKLNRNFHGEAVNYWGSGDLNNKFKYMRDAQNNKHIEYTDNFDYIFDDNPREDNNSFND